MSRLPKTVTLDDLLKVIDQSERLRPGTQRNYRAAVGLWIEYAGADTKKWTPERARDFYADLKKEKGLSAANGIMWGVRYAVDRVYKDARELSPMDIELGRPKAKPGDEVGALEDGEAISLLNACRGTDIVAQRDSALVTLGLFTGMRRSSLTSIDLGRIHTHRAFLGLDVVLKGGSEYRVPIDPRVWRLIEPYRNALRAATGSEKGPLFRRFSQHRLSGGRDASHEALTADGLYKALKGRAARAKLDFHPHVLRHTFVTWCRLAGLADFDIAVVTGHKGYGEIQRTYVDRTPYAERVAPLVWDVISTRLRL